MIEPQPSWQCLFERPAQAASKGAVELKLLVLHKAGQPLLVVPRGAPAATAALSLYPAQAGRAKLAKWLWRKTLRFGFAPGAQRLTLAVDPNGPLLHFMATVLQAPRNAPGGTFANGSAPLERSNPIGPRASPSPPPEGRAGARRTLPPVFALLVGYHGTPGRRFVMLVFDPQNRPAAIIKAGIGPAAIELINKESTLLAAAPRDVQGLPKLRQRFQHSELSAFAMDYVEGISPGRSQYRDLLPILNAWLDPSRTIEVRTLGAWQRLAQLSSGDAMFARLAKKLENLEIHPAIFHGDLAPWNIKVSAADGSWTMLDWERGDWNGPPAWDWFHYIVQPAILVQKLAPAALAQELSKLLETSEFRSYAQAAGLTGHERDWLLAYLFHGRDVLRPLVGSPREVLDLLAKCWSLL